MNQTEREGKRGSDGPKVDLSCECGWESLCGGRREVHLYWSPIVNQGSTDDGGDSVLGLFLPSK